MSVDENSLYEFTSGGEGSDGTDGGSDEMGGVLVVESDEPVEQLMSAVDDAVSDVMEPIRAGIDPTAEDEDGPPKYFDIRESVPMPAGPAIFVTEVTSDLRSDFFDAVEGIARRLEQDGHHGTIRYHPTQFPPPYSNDAGRGITVGMSLVGRPRAVPNGQGWTPDPAAQRHVIDRAMRWCRKAGPQRWLWVELAIEPASRQDVDRLIHLAAATNDAAVVCAKGKQKARRISFRSEGRVVLTQIISGSAVAATREVRDVLVDLSDDLDQAFVNAGEADTFGLWPVLDDSGWDPMDTIQMRSIPRAPVDDRRTLIEAHGLQLVGPGFRVPDLPSRWRVTTVGKGRTIIEDVDPDAWFDGPADRALKVEAHRELGSVVDQRWTPSATPPG